MWRRRRKTHLNRRIDHVTQLGMNANGSSPAILGDAGRITQVALRSTPCSIYTQLYFYLICIGIKARQCGTYKMYI